jgi:hypothetical protein
MSLILHERTYRLEVASIVRSVNQMSSLSKESMDSGSDHNSLQFSLLDSGPRKHLVSTFLRHW